MPAQQSDETYFFAPPINYHRAWKQKPSLFEPLRETELPGQNNHLWSTVQFVGVDYCYEKKHAIGYYSVRHLLRLIWMIATLTNPFDWVLHCCCNCSFEWTFYLMHAKTKLIKYYHRRIESWFHLTDVLEVQRLHDVFDVDSTVGKLNGSMLLVQWWPKQCWPKQCWPKQCWLWKKLILPKLTLI